jgi:hypothetical protein
MRTLSILVLAWLPTVVTSQNVAAEAQLSALFLEQYIEAQSQVCAKRFPATSDSWDTELKAWKERNASELSDMRDLSLQVQASLKARSAEAQLVAFQAQALVAPLSALAGYRDPEASQFCEDLRVNLSDTKMAAQAFSVARAAAAATLARGKSLSK